MNRPSGPEFVKRRTDAPPGFFAWEAAGLAWLGEAAAAGGAAVVGVREVGERHITLDRIEPARPTATAAEALGRALAITHAGGADAFGAGPPKAILGEPDLAALRGMPHFLAHGREDHLFPYADLSARLAFWQAAQVPTTFEGYAGGHDLDFAPLRAASAWILKLERAKPPVAP